MKAKAISILLAVLIIMTCSSCQVADAAWQDPSREDYINLPVFFITDRQIKLDLKKRKYSYGKQIDLAEGSSENSIDSLTFGIEQFRTRDPGHTGSRKWLSSFDLEGFGDRFNPKGLKWRTFSGLVYGQLYPWKSREKFYGQVKSTLSRSPEKEILIFVHGCCVDHKKAARQAVSIQKWYRRPVLLYDWGTNSKDYYQSLVSYPKTEDRFRRFIEDLKSRFENTRITVLAYSVGANILKDYSLKAVSEQGHSFENLILLRADTNIGELKKALPAMKRVSKNPIQVWVSSNDSQMLASRALRVVTILPRKILSVRGWRAGETGGWLEAGDDGTFEDIQVLDISRLGLGHEIPFRLFPFFARGPLKAGDLGPFTVQHKEDNLFYVSDR